MFKKTKVVVYFTGEEEKDKAIKDYCKKNNLKIIKSIYQDVLPHLGWNSSIYYLQNLFCKNYINKSIDYIITYSLEDLDECSSYQMAICHMLADIDAWICTVKEGKFAEDFDFECRLKKLLKKNTI